MARRIGTTPSRAVGAGRGRTGAGGGVRVILTTVPAAAAAALATSLVKARLAACVSEIPGVRSTYVWRARVERARESLLIIKTSRAKTSALQASLAASHPYETPEILVLDPAGIDKSYAAWVLASLD